MRGHFVDVLSEGVEIEREVFAKGSDGESEDSAEALP
jgi:hypothetical protein